jgi:hypothetical protein
MFTRSYFIIVIKIQALAGETMLDFSDFFTDSMDGCLLSTKLDAVSTPASATG